MFRFAGVLVLLALPPAAPIDSIAPPPADTLTRVAGVADSAGVTTAPRLIARAVLAEGGSGRGAVLDPTGVAVDPFGRVFVTDAALHRVLCFEADGRPAEALGSLGTDPSSLQRPSGVALLGTLGIAVLDRDNRRVQVVDLFGRRLGTLIDLASDDLERQIGRVDAIAIASDRGGALALLDQEADRVLLFDFSGRLIREVGGIGSAPGSFRGLRGIAFTPRGELVTADRGNARVQRFNAGGRVSATWPVKVGPGLGALALAVDGDGRVAMTDETSGSVWLWAADGTRLGRWEKLGHPRALAFAPDGTLLIAESTPPRVRRYAVLETAATAKER
ncbi:MAG: NHL repeat-containing protein [Candidatus Eisenbacteria bacterium]